MFSLYDVYLDSSDDDDEKAKMFKIHGECKQKLELFISLNDDEKDNVRRR